MSNPIHPPDGGTPGPALRPIDLGAALSAIARGAWSEIEAKAGLVVEIDAGGPVVADDQRLHLLLGLLVRHVLEGVPPGSPAEHVVGLASAPAGPELIRVEVRHVERGGPDAPGDPPAPDAAVARQLDDQLARWNALAHEFGASVEAEGTALPARALRLFLKTVR